jgi:hypothetical protein
MTRWLLLLLLIGLLAACSSPPPDEAQIRAQIDVQEQTAEAGEIGAFMDGIAENFGGQRGNLSREQLKELLRIQLLAHTRIGVTLTGIEVEVSKDFAEARFNALLTGGAGFIPDSGDAFDVVTDWQKIDDRWVVVAARWTRLGG